MPAKSAKQQRYFGMCAHSKNAPASCPSKKVSEEFSHKPKGGYRKMKKRKSKSEGDNWTGRWLT